jgi:hypothetical protein
MAPKTMKGTVILFLLLLLIPIVSATSYTEVTSSIIGKTPFGLLIDLHIEDYFPAEQAIMYYNYIAILIIVLWAAFASMSNESRFTFTTPFLSAFFVFVGWLNAGSSAVNYWGTLIFCMLLGGIMYMNDMNHEKYGLPGTGDKLMAVSFMIMCFTASFGFIASSEFGWFNENSIGTTQNNMCGTAYTCDSAGNVALDASVTTIKSTGGFWDGVMSDVYLLTSVAIAAAKLIIIVAGSILLFAVVILAAYPALAASPQVVAFLAVMNVVIWAIYITTFFRWMYKPGVGEGQI